MSLVIFISYIYPLFERFERFFERCFMRGIKKPFCKRFQAVSNITLTQPNTLLFGRFSAPSDTSQVNFV